MRKKKRGEKDVLSMDSVAFIIEFPRFFFKFSTIFEVAEVLIGFTDLLVDNIFRRFLSNFWAYTMSDMKITGCVKARLKMALFQMIRPRPRNCTLF